MEAAPQNGGSTTATGGSGRTLPADVWDRLKAKADELGGVGGDRMFADGLPGDDSRTPWCLAGIAIGTGDLAWRRGLDVTADDHRDFLGRCVELFGHTPSQLDPFIQRAGGSYDTRVPFEAVMAELGIVRGEAANA